MKISNQQALMLFQVLNDSLPIVNGFGFSQKIRTELYEAIIKQQNVEPMELEIKNNVENKECPNPFCGLNAHLANVECLWIGSKKI